MNSIILIFLFAALSCRATVSSEQCFSFEGNSYLLFSPNSYYDNRNRIHYEFKFQTISLHGILMYARGSYGDLEALYIRDGYLHYHLFNAAPSGIHREFGGYFVSDERVDTNDWITVHLYRSYTVMDPRFRTSHNKTGFEIEINGEVRSYVDQYNREGIDISSNIYFGGYSSVLSQTVGNFTGKIMGIKEEKNNYVFENPTLNYKSLVDLHCEDLPRPV